MIIERVESFHIGSTSDRYAMSMSPVCMQPILVIMFSQKISGYLYQWTW
jgi:hypothetical protein